MARSVTAALPTRPSPPPAKPARHRLRRPPPRLLILAIGAVAVLFLAGSFVVAQIGERTAEQERGAVADRAVDAADPVLALCDDASLVGEALRTARGNPCGLAEQIVTDPVPPVAATPAQPTERREQGPGPTPEQIQAAVRAELAVNPPADGQSPTPEAVAATVAAFLTANPPSPGRAPTAGEIADAVEAFFVANPPPAGADGRAPLPTSYTQTYSDGSTEECVRDGGPDTAPNYSCGTREPPPADSPGDGYPGVSAATEPPG